MRTFGFKEVRYQEARRRGVRFFRFEAGQKPTVTAQGEGLLVSLFDAGLARTVRLEADLLVLSAAIRPRVEGRDLAELLRLPVDQDGFFLEAHPKLRPLDFATAGFFLCGLAQGPKFANAAIAQAQGAVARAMTVLSQKEIVTEGVMTAVDQALCRGCGECEQACLFGAIKVTEMEGGRKQARVAQALCTGCGACNVACPTGAASLAHFRDQQVQAMIGAL
jgi:heterodisulfide reductase subunit A